MFGVSQRSWELSIKPLMPVVTRLYRHVVCRGTAVCGQVTETVAAGEADEGMVCCWTGTGASIAANKVPGIRAALVHDAETARGACLEPRQRVGLEPASDADPGDARDPGCLVRDFFLRR